MPQKTKTAKAASQQNMSGLTSPRIEEDSIKGFGKKAVVLKKKIRTMLPIIFVGNLSILLAEHIDGIICGQAVNADAVAAVNAISPLTTLLGAVVAVVSMGFSAQFVRATGEQDDQLGNQLKRAAVLLGTIAMAATFVLMMALLPIAISGYDISEEVRKMALAYGTGLAFASTFSVASSICTYILASNAQARSLLFLGVLEAVINIVLDLLFVVVFQWGTAGAGAATAVSCLTRATISVFLTWRRTDFFMFANAPLTIDAIARIVSTGLPGAFNIVLIAFSNYCFVAFLTSTFGDASLSCRAVGNFLTSASTLFALSVYQALTPYLGLVIGLKNRPAIHSLVLNAVSLILIVTALWTAGIMLYPQVFFSLYGCTGADATWMDAVRMYCIGIPFTAVNYLLSFVYPAMGKKMLSTILNVFENGIFIIGISFLLLHLAPSSLWLTYALSSGAIFIANAISVAYQFIRTRDDEVFAFTATLMPCQVRELIAKLMVFYKDHKIDENYAHIVFMCFDDLLAAFNKQESRHDLCLEVFVCHRDDCISIAIISDGEEPLDSVLFDEDEREDEDAENAVTNAKTGNRPERKSADGDFNDIAEQHPACLPLHPESFADIFVFTRKIASNIKISYAAGLNFVTIELTKGSESQATPEAPASALPATSSDAERDQ